jgi:2-keto-4-pentenoate hydratase/2-oxohepta-3-ene-1,7-dioic acid hydratase in catechol pathway
MTKWCRASWDGRVFFGLLDGDVIRPVKGSPFDAYVPTESRIALADVQLLLPVEPRNVYAIGVNYLSHIEWVNRRHGFSIGVPSQPDIGHRSVSALVPPGGSIVIPRDSPGPVEYEGELVAVVGKRAKHLGEDEALGCLLGYTLGNDVSERTWQRTDRTLWRAKNADASKPMGPVIATGLDPSRQQVAIRINGRTVSEYTTDRMLFSVQQYLSRVTRYVTLHPGDVIWLGTDGPTEPPLESGDTVEVVHADIGILRNTVIRET